MIALNTDEDMLILKNSFRLNFPALMATIVKILLYREEEKLACLLTAYYEIELRTDMIEKAIERNNIQWLMYVWAFGKNYRGIRRSKEKKFVSYEMLFR